MRRIRGEAVEASIGEAADAADAEFDEIDERDHTDGSIPRCLSTAPPGRVK